MNLQYLALFSILIFFINFLNILFAFTKSTANVAKWSVIVILFAAVQILSWFAGDLALQWVLIEACTLFGALLISMSENEKSTAVAWKFLLLNSFGMGIAFLGLIILSFGIHSVVTMDTATIMNNIALQQNSFVEIGIWLAVFGYSVKLGLVPNQYWVSDTYSESPSQISSLFASMIPVSVSIALRPIIQMDILMQHPHLNARHGLLVMGIATMIYSILTLYQAKDIRRITSMIALFHNGAIGVFLWLNTSDEIFYLALTSLVVIKTLIFSSMGILRLDISSRFLNEISPSEGVSSVSRILFLASVFMAFALPVSPMFLSDMMALKNAVKHSYYWYTLVPGLGICFFAITLYKILPVMNIESRGFKPENRTKITVRAILAGAVFILAFLLSIFGFYMFAYKGLGNV